MATKHGTYGITSGLIGEWVAAARCQTCRRWARIVTTHNVVSGTVLCASGKCPDEGPGCERTEETPARLAAWERLVADREHQAQIGEKERWLRKRRMDALRREAEARDFEEGDDEWAAPPENLPPAGELEE